MRGRAPEGAPSRSSRKRADRPVQDLARRLAELPEAEWQALPAPEDLRREILAAREIAARGARARQIKRVAALLRHREAEAEALREFVAGRSEAHAREAMAHKELEALRDRLCDPAEAEEALAEVAGLFPGLDPRALERLSRAARSGGDRRAHREIFRLLRRAREETEVSGREPG